MTGNRPTRRAACECAPFDCCSCDQTAYTLRSIGYSAARRAPAARAAASAAPMGPHEDSGLWWRPAAEIDADSALSAAYEDCAAPSELGY